MEHEIIRDHTTKRSRGFGFIVFDSENVVDILLANGNMIDMAGTQVSLVQWLLDKLDRCKLIFMIYEPSQCFLSICYNKEITGSFIYLILTRHMGFMEF